MLIDRDRSPSQEELTDAYKKFFQLFEKPVTISFPWDEVEIMPTGKRPNQVIEIMGLTRAGKSSFLNKFEESVGSPYPSHLISISPEFGNHREQYQALRDRNSFKGDYQAQGFNWDLLKLISYHESLLGHLDNQKKDIKAGIYRPSILLTERGPNDIIAHEQFYFMQASDKVPLPDFYNYLDDWDDFFEPDWTRYIYPKIDKIAELLNSSFVSAVSVDAVILYGVSLETAQDRREALGYERSGYLANDTTWSAYSYGHNWWLEHVYPFMKEHFGTGLLVVNGEKSLEENNEIVAQFVKNIMYSRQTKT